MQAEGTRKGDFEIMLMVLLDRQLMAPHQKLFPIHTSLFLGFG